MEVDENRPNIRNEASMATDVHLISDSKPTPKWVLLQTVKTQMKCRIMHLFIRVYTVKVKTSIDKKIHLFKITT